MNDELADQAIVIGWDRIAVVECAIHAHTKAAWRVILRDLARAGREIGQFFCVDAHFDSVAVDLQIFLREGHRLAFCNADLFAHQINAKDGFCHGMLDLQAGVHLDEIELAFLVEKLDRARADIVDIGHGVGADFADLARSSG